MKYQGSKRRIAKHILPLMLKYRQLNQCWVEPFVGGGNMIENVNGNRIGVDSNSNVIEALISIRDYAFKLPKNNKEFTKEDYIKAKQDEFYYVFRSYIGFACSFGAKWFNSWRQDKQGKRDYVAEAYRNVLKQNPKLQGVKLICSDYANLQIPSNSLIYCDPPYANTARYKGTGKFNHELFWEWCRRQIREGHTVFISEYIAPSDFKCIWKKEINCTLNVDSNSKKKSRKIIYTRN